MASREADIWLQAAADPQIAGELELLYEHIARDTAQRRPRCDQSGRCCDFDAWGHRLYVTGLEAAYLVARLEHPLTPGAIADARARGGCPFQRALLCTVHSLRPLGCRAYFCDPTSTDWQQDLTERMLAELRALHDRHDIPYRYAEWRALLETLTEPKTPDP
ncbi:MAG: YkgJ family cysteine cluster protein [Phycisphaerales bacterium]|nr:YkgJ family cysteine cluster protein [Phycisphaerales bacterium]